jgi:hypothetical protein
LGKTPIVKEVVYYEVATPLLEAFPIMRKYHLSAIRRLCSSKFKWCSSAATMIGGTGGKR